MSPIGDTARKKQNHLSRKLLLLGQKAKNHLSKKVGNATIYGSVKHYSNYNCIPPASNNLIVFLALTLRRFIDSTKSHGASDNLHYGLLSADLCYR